MLSIILCAHRRRVHEEFLFRFGMLIVGILAGATVSQASFGESLTVALARISPAHHQLSDR